MSPSLIQFAIRLIGSAALFLSLSATAAGPAQSANQKKPKRTATLKLNDGTSVQGRIVSLTDGVYLVESDSLGKLKVPVERILGISYAPPARKAIEQIGQRVDGPKKPAKVAPKLVVPTDVPATGNAEMQQMMQQMLGSPEIMKMVQQLSEDPSIQDMVNDPELQKAINSGQYLQLLSHPAVRGMMENPTVLKITEEVKSPAPKVAPKAETKPASAPKK